MVSIDKEKLKNKINCIDEKMIRKVQFFSPRAFRMKIYCNFHFQILLFLFLAKFFSLTILIKTRYVRFASWFLTLCLPVCPCICLSVCVSVRVSVCVCLSVYLSVRHQIYAEVFDFHIPQIRRCTIWDSLPSCTFALVSSSH